MSSETVTKTKSKIKTRDMAYIGLFAVLIAICAWISIPTTIPFTLQVLGVALAVGMLGGRRGTIAVLVYILLGAVGVPVFAGFKGGIGALLGNTGGYIIGFICMALVMWAMEKIPGNRTVILFISMITGLLVDYVFGTAWFMVAYAKNVGAVGLGAALGWCVIPYIIPDVIKLIVAMILSRSIGKYIVRD